VDFELDGFVDDVLEAIQTLDPDELSRGVNGTITALFYDSRSKFTVKVERSTP
jgi:hypothetical protein